MERGVCHLIWQNLYKFMMFLFLPLTFYFLTIYFPLFLSWLIYKVFYIFSNSIFVKVFYLKIVVESILEPIHLHMQEVNKIIKYLKQAPTKCILFKCNSPLLKSFTYFEWGTCRRATDHIKIFFIKTLSTRHMSWTMTSLSFQRHSHHTHYSQHHFMWW